MPGAIVPLSPVEAVSETGTPTSTLLADVSSVDEVQAVVELAVEQFGRHAPIGAL